jgi:transcriptional regulator with XRE-family HTH domain
VEVAERSGVAISIIRQVEQGPREPTSGTLVKLAAGLGVSLSAFDQAAATGGEGVKGRCRKAEAPPATDEAKGKRKGKK